MNQNINLHNINIDLTFNFIVLYESVKILKAIKKNISDELQNQSTQDNIESLDTIYYSTNHKYSFLTHSLIIKTRGKYIGINIDVKQSIDPFIGALDKIGCNDKNTIVLVPVDLASCVDCEFTLPLAQALYYSSEKNLPVVLLGDNSDMYKNINKIRKYTNRINVPFYRISTISGKNFDPILKDKSSETIMDLIINLCFDLNTMPEEKPLF